MPSEFRRATLRGALLATLPLLGGPACAPAVPAGMPPASAISAPPVLKTSCQRAHRIVAIALRTNGYSIESIERSAQGGNFEATRGKGEGFTGNDISVALTCGAEGVRIVPTGGGKWSEGGMRLSIEKIEQDDDRIWPKPRGAKVLLEQISDIESQIYFPQRLRTVGLTAVRVHAINGGVGPYRIHHSGILARTDAGGRGVPALKPEAAAKKIGGPLEVKLLGRDRVGNNESVVGFLLFAAGDYVAATVPLIDEETGEADQYEIRFKTP